MKRTTLHLTLHGGDMTHVVEYPLQTGGSVRIEVDDEETAGGIAPAGLKPGEMVTTARETLEAALDSLSPGITAIVEKLRDMASSPQEIGVEFGLTVKLEAGVVIAKTAMEATFKVSAKWHPPQPGRLTTP